MGVQNSNIVMGNSVDECAKAASTDGQLIGSYTFFGSLLAVGITGVERKKRAKGDDGGNAGYHRGFGTDQAEGYDILVVWIKCNQCGHSQVSAKTDG